MRPVFVFSALIIVSGLFALPLAAQTDSTEYFPADSSSMSGPLISSATAMETGWDLVKNPLTDSIGGGPERSALVRTGFRIFTQTPEYAGRFSGNGLSCGHCHLNAGQREKALPLVGVAAAFPEFNRRAGREFTLEDRIAGCFLRSMNATGAPAMVAAHDPDSAAATVRESAEAGALAAYISWLSDGYARGDALPWRGLNAIPDTARIPVAALDSARGSELYAAKCGTCHGEEGGGVAIGDIKAGPLWGPASWNDGAGAARVYTLAGMIRFMMPYVDPGSLTDEEAQQIASFICAQPRPVYPFKSADYRSGNLPPDAVYYKRSR
jgi:thiosulfate dehydrogenase